MLSFSIEVDTKKEGIPHHTVQVKNESTINMHTSYQLSLVTPEHQLSSLFCDENSMNMNNKNNNTTDDSSAGSVDDSTKPSYIRSIGVIFKLEPGVSAPNVTGVVHNSSVEGIDSTAVTGSRNENPLVIPSFPSLPTSSQSLPRLSNQSIIPIGSGGRNEPVDLVSPAKAGKMHSRDNSNHDTVNDTDNNKKINLDICLQKEASKEQALIVAAGAATSAAASVVTSCILPSTPTRQKKRQNTNKTPEKKVSASTEPPFVPVVRRNVRMVKQLNQSILDFSSPKGLGIKVPPTTQK